MSAAREPLIIGWLMTADPTVVEAVGKAGFDFVVLDFQHGAFDLGAAFRCIQLLDLMEVSVHVRMDAAELAVMPRLLDQGASGVILAMVTGPDVVASAVRLSRYQPNGERSYGMQRYGFRAEPTDVTQLTPALRVMIEDRRGFDDVASIVRVPGVTAIHIGPVDLSLAITGRMVRDERWRQAVEDVRAASVRAGIPVGIHATDGNDARKWRQAGFDEIVLGSDITLLRAALELQLTLARSVEQ